VCSDNEYEPLPSLAALSLSLSLDLTPFSRCAWFPPWKEPDWAQLLPDLVRKIGDHLLNDEVTEYICLRVVCQPWRHTTVDPSILEPRFFPRNWLMLSPGYKLRTDGVA
jgi:hypothetical protein